MKTKEELTQLKTEYETLNNKLKELSEEELEMVAGGDNEITILKKDLSFRYEGVTYYVCEDTAVYSLDQIVYAYKDRNEPLYTSPFLAGEIMQRC